MVYADFNKIILNTKKRTVVDALSYVQYITDNIKNKEIFHSIEMSVVQSWDVLLWCDPANFGGVSSGRGEESLDEEDAPPEVSRLANKAFCSLALFLLIFL